MRPHRGSQEEYEEMLKEDIFRENKIIFRILREIRPWVI